MNRLLALMLCAVSLGATAQVTYPYNPDGNADALIGVTDLQDMLTVYGQPFLPSEILVEGQTLTTVLTDLQHSIDSLSALSGGGGGSVLDMPLGTILPVASETVPEGWVLCDGRELAIEDYQGLYDLIGTTYGAGDSAFWAQVFFPATTFNIPDLRGRTIIGANDMGGEQSDILAIHQAAIGQIGGEEMHQLTEAEMPSHSHDFPKSTGSSNNIGPSGGVYSAGGWQTNTAGGDQPHNNMQPYMALNYMIKIASVEDAFAALQSEVEDIATSVEQLENVQAPIFTLECIDAGVAANCFGEVNPLQFESANNYDYSISPYCSSAYTDDYVSPTWRMFKVAGLSPSLSNTKIGFRYWETSNYLESQFTVSLGHEVEVINGEFLFVLYGSMVGSIWDGLWPQGVVALQADYNYSGGSNSSGSRSHYELMIEVNGSYLDTGLRFNP